MGNVGDQIGFQTLTLDRLLHRPFQAVTHMIDGFRHFPVVSRQILFIDFEVQLSPGDSGQTVADHLPAGALFYQIQQHDAVGDQRQKNTEAAESEKNKHISQHQQNESGNHLA